MTESLTTKSSTIRRSKVNTCEKAIFFIRITCYLTKILNSFASPTKVFLYYSLTCFYFCSLLSCYSKENILIIRCQCKISCCIRSCIYIWPMYRGTSFFTVSQNHCFFSLKIPRNLYLSTLKWKKNATHPCICKILFEQFLGLLPVF